MTCVFPENGMNKELCIDCCMLPISPPPQLTHYLPWESLSCLRNHSVTRMPSLLFAANHFNKVCGVVTFVTKL